VVTVRAQAHALEGIAAALVLLSAVGFALQATAVTPLTASTSNQFIENQQSAVASDLLDVAVANESLRPAVLAWNGSRDAFRGSPDRGYFTDGGPPTRFGAALNETFGGQRVAFNVHVESRTNGSTDRVRMVYMGTPSDNAVTESRAVVLFDDDELVGGSRTVGDAAAAGEFYADDRDRDGPLFNLVEVEITVWRI
jgi:hypothetical protein